MAYIRLSKVPGSIGVGRTARNASFKADSLTDWCAEVDEPTENEVQIAKAVYDTLCAENKAYNAALPPPPEPAPPPPPPVSVPTAAEVAALEAPATGPLATLKAILSKADADITAAEVKAVTLLMARYFLKKFVGGWR